MEVEEWNGAKVLKMLFNTNMNMILRMLAPENI